MAKPTFCYDTARELRRVMTREELAEYLGVSESAIEYACNDKFREQQRARCRERQRSKYVPKKKVQS